MKNKYPMAVGYAAEVDTTENVKGAVGCILATVVLLVLLVVLPIVWNVHREEATVTVVERMTVSPGDAQHYLVSCEIEGQSGRHVLIVADSLWYWRWNSSDVWSNLEVGKQYRVTTAGYRIPIMSRWKNIIRYEEQ